MKSDITKEEFKKFLKEETEKRKKGLAWVKFKPAANRLLFLLGRSLKRSINGV